MDWANPLRFHFNLFTLPDKYDIPHLRQVAAARFTEFASHAHHFLTDVIESVFTTTPSSVQELRQAVVNIAHLQLEQLVKEASFQEVMDRNGEFGRELMMKLRWDAYKGPDEPGMVQFGCRVCDFKFLMSFYVQVSIDGLPGFVRTFGTMANNHRNGAVYSRCP